MGFRAFIVRPFGTKADRNQLDVDFEKVDAELIQPALARLGIDGGTTQEVVRAGNIREDMFHLLLTSDLVIADVSVDNANVFYELGIRQALRDKWTVLLRCKADKVPFDLSTDRYLSYDRDNPAAAVDALVDVLNETINGNEQDSPVFKLLPELQVQDHRRFLPVPPEFRVEVDRAERDNSLGELELLGEEARGFEWDGEGLRAVGRAQFRLKAYARARHTWEGVQECFQGDIEADQRLATIYQRLGDLNESDLAVERALRREGLSARDRSEIHALLASNAKTRWRNEWAGPPPDRLKALQSPFLLQTLKGYEDAFSEDFNYFYPGINALAMNVIRLKLAEALPDAWQDPFESVDEADRELKALRDKSAKLASAIDLVLQTCRSRQKDFWTEIAEAVRVMLTTDRPGRVTDAYRRALANADPFTCDAERRQLQLYEQLGILEANVQAAIKAFPAPLGSQSVEKKRVVLFAGHMLDAPDRVPPRFPAEKEEIARQAIREALLAERQLGEITYGVAGGSHGGDLLFHEVCQEMGIKTELWLALPPERYVAIAVQNYIGDGTDKLVQRFRRLQNQLTIQSMADNLELPRWLRTKRGYDFWQRHTLWMVHKALTVGTENLTLIALWNHEQGNGTADFVQRVGERGAKVVPLSTKRLFGF